MSILLKCFNQYDIRGIVGKELNSTTAYQLGRLLNAQSIVIAKDNRPSSSALRSAFCQGLLDSGCQVFELEAVSSTPLLYFAHMHLQTQYAVMITGSHNALEYNGFKFMKNGKAFYGDALKQILLNSVTNHMKAEHKVLDLRMEYRQALLRNIKFTRKFKIAWECNNSGVASILQQIGEDLLLNASTNGIFAHEQPDPLIENNLKELKRVIEAENCDFGFAFDGDADRLVMVKANGEVLTSDQLIYLLALSLETTMPQKIILDVKASQLLVKALENKGFEVLLAPGGHSIMKAMIVNENAILAGEASGHFIINDQAYYPFDDALYIALRLIKYLENNPITELELAPIRQSFKIPIDSDEKQKFIAKYKAGIRKIYENSWLLVRASHTEDYILIKYEAMTPAEEEAILMILQTLEGAESEIYKIVHERRSDISKLAVS